MHGRQEIKLSRQWTKVESDDSVKYLKSVRKAKHHYYPIATDPDDLVWINQEKRDFRTLKEINTYNHEWFIIRKYVPPDPCNPDWNEIREEISPAYAPPITIIVELVFNKPHVDTSPPSQVQKKKQKTRPTPI